MAELDAGRTPNRRDFVARHPEIATELSACLQGLQFINGAVEQLQTSSLGKSATKKQVTDDHEPTRRSLGDFELIRELGRGGMGVVYEAHQISLGRQVALKVLATSAALDSRALQRFRNEAQAAAQLHHSNIVPVYAVGCDKSVHFYAMQLIEGQSLADVVQELRLSAKARLGVSDSAIDRSDSRIRSGTSSSSGSRLLKPRQPSPSTKSFSDSLVLNRTERRNDFFRAIAQLGVQAAEALDYAHSYGVVHRDIKPANLLLDHRGNLWVTDFGLAQFQHAAEDSNLTITGDLLGTMRYMSPEQASGRATLLDARTDIYSLGLTLYELITLQRALPGQTREELLRQIITLDPKPLRAIDRTVPVDLQTIVAKAIAKDVRERYLSAKALAEDLQRFLLDQPIAAKPPSALSRLRRWRRQHRGLATAAVAMLTVIGLASLVSNVLIANEQAKTKQAYLGEQRNAEIASQNAQQATRNAALAEANAARAIASEKESKQNAERALQKEREANANADRAAASEQQAQANAKEAKQNAAMAVRNAAEASAQGMKAEANLQQARKAIDLLTQVASDELSHDQASNAARKHLLEVALKYYEQLDTSGDSSTQSAASEQVHQHAATLLNEIKLTTEGARLSFNLRLLTDSVVQNELGLTNDQRTKLNQLKNPGQTLPPNLSILEPKSTVAFKSQLAGLLTTAQYSRLVQISRQARGVAAFEDEDVRAVLKLSDAQADFIRHQEAVLASLTSDPSQRDGDFADRTPEDRPQPRGRPSGSPRLDRGPDHTPPDHLPGPPPNDDFNEENPTQPASTPPRRRSHTVTNISQQVAAATQAIVKQLTPEQSHAWSELTGKPMNSEFFKSYAITAAPLPP